MSTGRLSREVLVEGGDGGGDDARSKLEGLLSEKVAEKMAGRGRGALSRRAVVASKGQSTRGAMPWVAEHQRCRFLVRFGARAHNLEQY